MFSDDVGGTAVSFPQIGLSFESWCIPCMRKINIVNENSHFHVRSSLNAKVKVVQHRACHQFVTDSELMFFVAQMQAV